MIPALLGFGVPAEAAVRCASSLAVETTQRATAAYAAERGDVVAFEADDVAVDRHLGWTVTAVGHLSVVPPDEATALKRTLPLHTWAPLRKQQLIRLGTESLTGRRLQPWAQRPKR